MTRHAAAVTSQPSGADGSKGSSITRLLARLAGLLAGHVPVAGLILLGLLLEMAFNALLPFSFRFIVDDGLLGGNHTLLAWIVGAGAAAAITVSVVGLGRDYLFARLVARVLADLRHTMFTKLQRLSLDFYGRTRVGDILGRFSGDLAAVETALTNAVPWGILPALETSHAIAWAVKEAARRPADEILVICLSGRGDKDAAEIARLRGMVDG